MKENQKGIASIVFVIIIVFLLGLVTYFALQSTNNKRNGYENQPLIDEQTEMTSTVPVKVSEEESNKLPAGWLYKSTGDCSVKFGIPPKEKPYYEPYDSDRTGSRNTWNFPRGAVGPTFITKFPNGIEQHKQVVTMYGPEEGGGSGYVASAVAVSCLPNTNNYNNQELLNVLKTLIIQFNKDTGFKGMEANKYTIEAIDEVGRWGNQVLDLTVSAYYENPGGEPYTEDRKSTVFTSHDYIYEVEVLGELENDFVIKTANDIFDSLIFE